MGTGDLQQSCGGDPRGHHLCKELGCLVIGLPGFSWHLWRPLGYVPSPVRGSGCIRRLRPLLFKPRVQLRSESAELLEDHFDKSPKAPRGALPPSPFAQRPRCRRSASCMTPPSESEHTPQLRATTTQIQPHCICIAKGAPSTGHCPFSDIHGRESSTGARSADPGAAMVLDPSSCRDCSQTMPPTAWGPLFLNHSALPRACSLFKPLLSSLPHN